MENETVTQRTVVELDLKGFGKIAHDLEEQLSANVVLKFQEQIQDFIDTGLAVVRLTREQTVMATTGDGAILVFEDPNNAHRFAEAVHEACRTHNHDRTSDAAKRWFRIGIASGDLVVKEKAGARRIAGSVISRAVRLEAAAKVGEIIADMATYNALANDLKDNYGDEEIIAGKEGEAFRAHRYIVVPEHEQTPINAAMAAVPAKSEQKSTPDRKDIEKCFRKKCCEYLHSSIHSITNSLNQMMTKIEYYVEPLIVCEEKPVYDCKRDDILILEHGKSRLSLCSDSGGGRVYSYKCILSVMLTCFWIKRRV